MRTAWKVVKLDRTGRRWSWMIRRPYRLEYPLGIRVEKIAGTPGIFCYSSRAEAERWGTAIKVQLHGRLRTPQRVSMTNICDMRAWIRGSRKMWLQAPKGTICADAVTALE